MSRHALVIGVSEYSHDRSIGNLPAARTDLNIISKVLREQGEFQVTSLPDPDQKQLMRALEDHFNHRDVNDTVLVYFSGHGLTDDSRDRLYLAATDTHSSRLDSSAVEAAFLQRMARETKARTKMLFLDCCFAGMAGDGLRARSARVVPIGTQLNKHGIMVLTASDRTSPSFEDSTAIGKPALFTEVVVEAMSGGAKDEDGDGWISMQDVAQYVQNSDKLKDQSPRSYSNGVNGALMLVRARQQPTEQVEMPTVIATREVREPVHPADEPLDPSTWRRLFEYYAACLRREAGLTGWLPPRARGAFQTWPASAEAVFTGDGAPQPLPETVREFVRRNYKKDTTLYYGYPSVITKDNRGTWQMAPLVVAELSINADGNAEAESIQLNEILLDNLGIEAPDIADLRAGFTANFRYADTQHFTEQLRFLAKAIDLPTTEELTPATLTDSLSTSPMMAGAQNVAIVYCKEDSDNATRNLLKDLQEHLPKQIPQLSMTALKALAAKDDVDESWSGTLVTPGPLNESQEAVVKSAMTRRLTVATGPPGTGKTALVTALAATAIAAGQSILIGSSNNEAVSGVYRKANAIADGMMIRTGKREFVDAEAETLGELLSQVKQPEETNAVGGRLRAQHAQVDGLRAELDKLTGIEADLLSTTQRIAQLRQESKDNSAVLATLAAPDALLTKAAAKARHSLLRWPLGSWPRRRVRRQFGIDAAQGRRDLTELLELEQSRRELLAELEVHNGDGLWKDLKKLSAPRIDNSVRLAAAVLNQRIHAGRSVIEQRIENLRSSSPKSWKGFARLLHHVPGWATTGHSAGKLVPTPGLFDLVVIDEAAQCPTPVVLGLLMRAKRALIIGDPHQIPPVAQLSLDDDDLLRRKAGLGREWLADRKLGYVNASIYDACATAAGEVSLLDEHYRCDPSIAAVPNHSVYQGKLAVLTDTTRLAIPGTPSDPAVQVIHVDGEADRPTSGSCRNIPEAEQVVELAVELRAKYPQASIGIVSPFKAQVTQLDRRLKSLSLEPPIKTGTAHRFQGDECDIIILSPVGSDGIRASSAQWMVKQTNLWNVAITRAKSRLVVVCNRKWWSQQSGLLPQLLAHNDNVARKDVDTQVLDRLQLELEGQGIEVMAREQSLAGQPCHLLIKGDDRPRALVIDSCDPQSGRAHRQLLAKLDLLSGAGYEPVRIPLWRCFHEPEAIAQELV